MSDLTAFLRARLDEDEKLAREADGISRDAWLELYGDLVRSRPLNDQRRVFGIFISTFTSGRTLWDIAAKRRLLDWLERTRELAAENNLWAYDDAEPLKILALPYAGHRDYRREWRP